MESDTVRPPSGFIVVECQTAPIDNKCVCVPRSWIQCELEEKVAIAYPDEDESRITARIANNEPASGAWSHYIGEIKYEAESYEDAVVGYLEENVKQIEEKRCKKSDEAAAVGVLEKNVEQYEEKSCKLSIPESYEDAVGGSEEKKVKQIEEKSCKIDPGAMPKDSLKLRIVLPKLDLKPGKKSKSFKKYLKEQSKDKIHKSKTKNEANQALKENTPSKKNESTSDSGDSGVAEGSTRSEPEQNNQNNAITSEKSLESKVEDVIIESLQQSVKEININDSPDKSRKTISECLDIEADNDIDLSNSNLTPEDKRTVITLQINQRNTRDYIKAVLIHIKTLYIKYIEEKKTLNALLLKLKDQPPATVVEPTEQTQPNVQAFQEESSLSDEMETLRYDDEMVSDDDADKPATQENDNTLYTKQQDMLVEMDTQTDNESDFETFIDDEESTLSSLPSSPEPEKPKRQIKRGRYQESSTWSLKHSKPGNGLEPFGPSNQVFISTRGFEKAKTTSKNVKMLARSLFREIFKPQALRTCTMTGRRAYFCKNTGYIRRQLHSGAMNEIINYSMSYGITMQWDDTDKNGLIRSLRSLLQNSRRVLKKQN